jgi:hypothetical protein
VALSVYAHGLTAWPGANRYADWYDARHEDHKVMPESVPVAEQRAPIGALLARRSCATPSCSAGDVRTDLGHAGHRRRCRPAATW